MLNECRRSSLKSASTQTSFLLPPSISIEDFGTYTKAATYDEEYEKDSIRSFSSRDSGIPVSRNQSFASSRPRSQQNTLCKQHAFDAHFADPVTSCSYAEFSNTIKDFSGSEVSDSEKETSLKSQTLDSQKTVSSGGSVKTIESPIALRHNPFNNAQMDSSTENTPEMSPDIVPLSLRSESLIPQTDTLAEDGVKTKKFFSFSFFTRSKKYSLPKNPSKDRLNVPSPDSPLLQSTETVSPASSRNGMTSIDVKRCRKQTQLSNHLLVSDNTSLASGDTSDTASNHFEQVFEHCHRPSLPISRSYSTTEECQAVVSEDHLRSVSKSTSDLTQAIPPPPPPPPPFPNSSNIVPRPKSNMLGLPGNKSLRSSWSGNPTIKEFDSPEDRLYNTLPRPKSKMKTLNWAKIPSSHVSVHSIWSEIDKESKPVELNFEEMEKLFCQDEPVRKTSKAGLKKRDTPEVSILDNKRSLSISVFLKQFKGGLDEVVEYVRQCRHREIGAEKLRTLVNLLPTPNEVKLLNSYSEDRNKLGTAEKFVLRLSAIDHYECRVEGMLLLEEFPATIEILHDSVQSLLDACQELLTNKGLKNFLKLVLVTGNFMNSGSYAGNAVGFRLSTLPKLMETRANRPRITLLHYLVEETRRKDPDGIKFTDELLGRLRKCSRITLENVSSEITHLDRAVQKLHSQVKTENGQLKKQFLGFAERGMKHLTILKSKMEEIQKISIQLANRFCEDEKRFQLEECLNIVNVFCEKIKIADAENQSRKLEEEKRQNGSASKLESKHRSSKTSTL